MLHSTEVVNPRALNECCTLDMIQFVGIFSGNPRSTSGDSANKSGQPAVENRNVVLFFVFACDVIAARALCSSAKISSVSGSPVPLLIK